VGVFGFEYQLTKVRKEKETEEEHEPMWYGFLTFSCMIAVIAGVVVGQLNFSTRMKQFYDLQHLNTFYDIEPSEYVGEQLVDAGRITFKDKVHVDVSHSMGFKNDEMYCVAPVVHRKLKRTPFTTFGSSGKTVARESRPISIAMATSMSATWVASG
jgi:hypothetical protein